MLPKAGKGDVPMGAWGGGLYDRDFARDLKGVINGVLRAPLTDDEVLAEIWASHGQGAGDADALDYCSPWPPPSHAKARNHCPADVGNARRAA